MQLVVALAAEDAAGVQALRLLGKRDLQLAAVFTSQVASGGGATVAAAATAMDLPVRPPEEVRDPALAEWLRAQGVDLLVNVHSLHLVHPRVLEAPSLGSFNLHPGPLPERAGLNSPSWALYEGDDRHGVTLHRMTPGIDEGPIAFADAFPVSREDSALAVLTQCVRRGVPLIERLLERGERREAIPALAQDLSKRRLFGAGPPQDGCLDWEVPARRVVDFVRACDYGPFPSPWGSPRCSLRGRELGVRAATPASNGSPAAPGTVAAAGGEGVLVAATDGWVRVTRIEIDGEPAEPAALLHPGDRLERARRSQPSAAPGGAVD